MTPVSGDVRAARPLLLPALLVGVSALLGAEWGIAPGHPGHRAARGHSIAAITAVAAGTPVFQPIRVFLFGAGALVLLLILGRRCPDVAAGAVLPRGTGPRPVCGIGPLRRRLSIAYHTGGRNGP
jgi:hypothetical protein